MEIVVYLRPAVGPAGRAVFLLEDEPPKVLLKRQQLQQPLQPQQQPHQPQHHQGSQGSEPLRIVDALHKRTYLHIAAHALKHRGYEPWLPSGCRLFLLHAIRMSVQFILCVHD